VPPNFYNLGDQAIYSAGDFFIPQERYRAAPYNVNTPTAPDDPATSGIAAVYRPQGGGGGGGALQADDPMTNFDNFYDYTGNKYFMSKDRPNLDSYSDNIQKTFMGFPSYRQQELTGADLGEYIGSGTDTPLELTRAGKIQESLRGIKEGIGSFAEKVGGIGPISMILGSMDRFNTLPKLDQEFIKANMGYTGPTIFGENTTGLSKDPFGVNVRSAFGNYAEKVRSDFEKLSETLGTGGKISEKYGVSYDPVTGEFTGRPEDIEKFKQMNKMNLAKLNFRYKQIQQQEKNKRDAEKAERVQAIQDNQRTQRRSDGSGGGNLTRSRDQGGLGLSASQAQAVSKANAAAGMGGWRLADGGRVPYMMGGLADLVDIYD
jgi:hypothetical protein